MINALKATCAILWALGFVTVCVQIAREEFAGAMRWTQATEKVGWGVWWVMLTGGLLWWWFT